MKLHFSFSRLNQPTRWILALLLIVTLSLTFTSITPALAACDPNATVTRISLGWDGSEANQSVNISDISANGRFIVLWSFASNLVNNDTNNAPDAFVYDRLSCQMILVSLTDGGLQGNGASYGSSISDDGRYVVFFSEATNIVANDTNSQSDVFVRDRTTGHTIRISVSSAGNQANSASVTSSDQAISSDGRYIVFGSGSTNLVANDTNGKNDVFVRDTQTNQTTRVSVASNGTQANGSSADHFLVGDPIISSNGNFIAFESFATNLVVGDANTSCSPSIYATPSTNCSDTFRHDRQTGETILVSVGSDEVQANLDSHLGTISADGNFIAFNTKASNLTSGDTNAKDDVFVRDVQTGLTTRESISSGGLQANDAAYFPKISADSRYVSFYSSATNLIDEDTNSAQDVFVRDRQTQQTIRMPQGLQGNANSLLGHLSGNGYYMALYSDASNLVSGDTNGTSDIFVAQAFAPTAQTGSTFTVNTLADVNDGICGVIECSLREAIIAANAAPGSTVEVPPGTYTLSIAGTQEDAAATGDLDITANMTIQGTDPSTTIIDANQIDRVFQLTGNNTVNVYNLTIRNGWTRYNGVPGNEGKGGGFFVLAGTLNLDNDIITANSATSGGGIGTDGAASKVINIVNTTLSENINFLDQLGEGGGAIFAYNTILNLTDSIVTANIGKVGGIYSYAPTLTITRTLFSEHNGTGLYAGGNITITDSSFINNDGGGIINFGNLIATGSTFTGNTGLSNGGAIYAWRGTAQIKNSTFSGNSAIKGGAIYNADATDSQGTSNATITNNTFYGNTATSGNGSGIYSDADGTVTLRANIFSNGSGSNCAVNAGGTLTSTGYNISDNGTCSTYLTNPTDQNNVIPLLGALQNNGGNTFTHALQAGSLAIDAIPAGNCTLTTDQRGIARPQGSACDIGAYEVEPVVQIGPTFTVNVTNDNNNSCTTMDCSLREAITAANVNSDTNIITFSIAGSGLHTIQPTTPLPWITNPVIIDGTTQPGYVAGAPVIELNGANAVTSFPPPHIDLVGINIVGGSNVTVRGLIVNGWNYGGIGVLNGSNNVIEGNFIGTNAAGTTAVPNLYGVIIYNGSNNRVGGTTAAQRNVIAGNNDDGVNIGGATSAQAVANLVQGNYIGTNAAGIAALGNGDDGVKVEIADGTIIGGTTAAARNIIAASVHNGVILKGADTIHSLVQGNYIGTDVTGTVDLGNTLNGVQIESASDNTIGGTIAGARNIISGNENGVAILNATATHNLIQGNYIGTDVTGTAALGNTKFGVVMTGGASINTIGGSAAGTGNVISANNPSNGSLTGAGIGVSGTNNLVQGNYIGTDAAGIADLGNGFAGIWIDNATDSVIGNVGTGGSNIIAFNHGDGIYFRYISGTARGNRINRNSIFSNAGLGIDLGNIDGVTPNDLNDTDTGANELQNFPVLAAATTYGTSVTIAGSLNSGATPEYLIEFFANAACDPSGYGEGQTYLGFTRSQTGINHDLNFNVNLPAAVPVGQFITATTTVITSGTGTSEFSACVPVVQGASDTSQAGPIFIVNTAADSNDGMCGVNTCSLRDAIIAANANPNTNTITFNILPAGAATIQLTSELPAITYPVIIDGATQPGYAGTPIIELDGSLVGSSKNGLTLDGGNSTVRGLVINRFTQYGIFIETNGGNTIQGNYIGTDISGTIARGNGTATLSVGAGIFVVSGNNLIGGTTPAARNVISGNVANGGAGIGLVGSDASSNTIQGNYLGTNASGTAALGNSYGVVMNSGNSTIGGTTPAARNIISGNTVGVLIQTANNVVQGNYIGTDVTGSLAVGNTDTGIQFLGNTIVPGSNNQIGGTVPGAGNVIAFNGTEGIRIDNLTVLSGEAIQGNSIFSNGALGIDLAPVGVNPNDAGDADTGMNNRQNFPVVSAANLLTNATSITGTLNSEANKTYRLEFFANVTCDSSGNGEGQIYLGFTNLNTNGSGNASFTVNMAAVSIGTFITTTATDPTNNTSEFSACVSVSDSAQSGITFTVNTAADSNDGTCGLDNCSLREAIAAANANNDMNTITFSIGGGGLHTIQPTTPLPWITNPVIIDGTTQLGYAAGAPVIELNGANAVSSFPPPHIDLVGINIVGGSNVTVRGLIVNGWNYGGIGILNGSNNVIEGNFIGTNAAGTTAVPNLYGVIIYNGSNNRVGGTTAAQRNVIAGNNDDGVNIGGATSAQAVANLVQGNYIGTDVTGTAALGNGDDGVKVEIADGTIVGGTTAAARNIIAASVHNGVILKGADTVNSVVEGNYIGTDVNGTLALGNGQAGVRIEGAVNSTIGGTVAGARNIVSGNTLYGIFVDSAGTGNSIEGNYVGTDVTGTIALTPQSAGVALSGNDNILGGTIPGARNIISGNVVGLAILGNGNFIQGNYIGTDVSGNQSIGNISWGIEVVASAANNIIGGSVAGAGNLIAHNGSNGVTLHGATVGIGNAILGNSIFSNAGLGIDLSISPVSGGVTSNDPGDVDVGPNNLQNFPVLTAATPVTNGTAVIGTLNSEANKTYRLEFFANVTCDSLGNGEGQTYFGFTNATTNGGGNASFTAPVAVVSAGKFITATATDLSNNNTSEFSACVPVVAVSLPAAAPIPNYYRTTSVPLTWTGVTWATGYEIQVDNNADFGTPEYSSSLGADVRSNTANLPPVDAVYYWRVGAKQANSTIIRWSAPQIFTVDIP